MSAACTSCAGSGMPPARPVVLTRASAHTHLSIPGVADTVLRTGSMPQHRATGHPRLAKTPPIPAAARAGRTGGPADPGHHDWLPPADRPPSEIAALDSDCSRTHGGTALRSQRVHA